MNLVAALFRTLIPALFLVACFGFAFLLGLALAGPAGPTADHLFGGVGLFWPLLGFALLAILTGIASLIASACERFGVATVPPRV